MKRVLPAKKLAISLMAHNLVKDGSAVGGNRVARSQFWRCGVYLSGCA
jgi:hypothetical protein